MKRCLYILILCIVSIVGTTSNDAHAQIGPFSGVIGTPTLWKLDGTQIVPVSSSYTVSVTVNGSLSDEDGDTTVAVESSADDDDVEITAADDVEIRANGDDISLFIKDNLTMYDVSSERIFDVNLAATTTTTDTDFVIYNDKSGGTGNTSSSSNIEFRTAKDNATSNLSNGDIVGAIRFSGRYSGSYSTNAEIFGASNGTDTDIHMQVGSSGRILLTDINENGLTFDPDGSSMAVISKTNSNTYPLRLDGNNGTTTGVVDLLAMRNSNGSPDTGAQTALSFVGPSATTTIGRIGAELEDDWVNGTDSTKDASLVFSTTENAVNTEVARFEDDSDIIFGPDVANPIPVSGKEVSIVDSDTTFLNFTNSQDTYTTNEVIGHLNFSSKNSLTSFHLPILQMYAFLDGEDDRGAFETTISRDLSGSQFFAGNSLSQATFNGAFDDVVASSRVTILETSNPHLALAYNSSNYWTWTVASDAGLTIANAGTDGDVNFNLSGATDGDFSVNSSDLFVDSSIGIVGIGTASPTTTLDVNGPITFHEQSSDPNNPAEGSAVIWMSNGVGSGDDGDIMVKITAGATTKTITLIDFSAF